MGAGVALDRVKKWVEGGKRRLPRELYLKARPLRNERVRSETFDGGVRLFAPLETQGTGLMGMIAKWSKLPDEKEFELEEVGAFVWEHCDGEHTTEGIARRLRERFKMNRLEAETALGAFLETLSGRRLIVLMAPRKK